MKMDGKKKEKLFMRDFFRKVGKAIYDYDLIEDNDKILVGVSGGKDSLALLEVLALRARASKQRYRVVAAHVAVENVAYEVDADYIKEFYWPESSFQLISDIYSMYYRSVLLYKKTHNLQFHPVK